MITMTRGRIVALLCETIDRKTNRPKADVTGATATIFGLPASGPAVSLATVPLAVTTGAALGTWEVPADLPYDAGYVEYTLTDGSADSPTKAREDATFIDMPGDLSALIGMLTYLYAAERGGWMVDRTTGVLTYYGTDGVTPISRWQLLDKFGHVTTIPGNAYGRRRLP